MVPPPFFKYMGIGEIINRFSKIQEGINKLSEIVGNVVYRESAVLLSLNKDQMLLGRNTEGKPIRPTYLNDPYFKTKKQAKAYAEQKKKLESKHNARIENPTLYPPKSVNTPNLIVTGPFQDSMFITTGNSSFLIGSSYMDSDDIEKKYHNLVFGLSPESKAFFYKHYIHPELLKLLKK